MYQMLELLYNRTRQAKITNELIEVVSGAVVQEDLADDG
jgi:F0F1-type ATP synthase gamma subunit